MSFVHPILAGVGLACVAVPILIHILMRRRRAPMAWGAMRFLIEAYRRQRRRLAFEQLLLLAARCLVVALVALAVGRLGAGVSQTHSGPRDITLMIDTGLASQATDAQGQTALDRHIARATQIVGQLDAARGDRVAVVALGSPADPVVMPASSDLASVVRAIGALEPTDGSMDLAGGLAALDEADGSEVIVLSDWLAGSAQTDRTLATSPGLDLQLSEPAERGVDSVAVTQIRPDRAVVLAGQGEQPDSGGSSQVRVTLQRTGPGVGRAAQRRVRLMLQHADRVDQLGEGTVRFAPGRAVGTVAIPVELGSIGQGDGLLIARADPDAIPGDDAMGLMLRVRSQLRVGVIGPPAPSGPRTIDRFTPGDWAELALTPQAGRGGAIGVTRLAPSSVDRTRLAGLDAAVVTEPGLLGDAAWADLGVMARAGGVVIVTPDARPGAQLWTDRLAEELGVGWSIGREAIAVGGAQGWSIALPESARAGLLAQLIGELEALVRPVRVSRALSIRTQGIGRVELSRVGDAGDEPLIVSAPPGRAGEALGRGLVVLIGTALDLDWTTLPAKPLMVPMMQELIRQGVGEALGSFAGVAGGPIGVPAGTVQLRELGPRSRVIGVSSDGQLRTPIRRAGAYSAVDRDGSELGLVMVNPQPGAGAGDATDRDTITRWIATTGSTPRWLGEDAEVVAARAGEADEARDAGSISLMLFLLAALVAAVETVLARLASHARVGTQAEARPMGGA